MSEFGEKRQKYMNSWPNCEPFEMEKKYSRKASDFAEKNGAFFVPFPLEYNDAPAFNISVSHMIEAFDQLNRFPNHSYEFMFQAFDCFIDEIIPGNENNTIKIKKACAMQLNTIIDSNTSLKNALNALTKKMPVKACQYLYIKLYESQPLNRIKNNRTGSETTADLKKRGDLIDKIKEKYHNDYHNYSETIRPASLLYRHILTEDSVTLDKEYTINLTDKIVLMVCGFLYTLRNDMMHGSGMSATKSSLTNMSSFAMNYFAFLMLYYFTLILIIEKYKSDYPNDIFDKLAENITLNTKLYKALFGKSIEQ